jgi:hypothetical protein
MNKQCFHQLHDRYLGAARNSYCCLREPTAAYGSLRLPNLAIVYLVAHYTQIEHSVSSASIHYMTDTCRCAQQISKQETFSPPQAGCQYMLCHCVSERVAEFVDAW